MYINITQNIGNIKELNEGERGRMGEVLSIFNDGMCIGIPLPGGGVHFDSLNKKARVSTGFLIY